MEKLPILDQIFSSILVQLGIIIPVKNNNKKYDIIGPILRLSLSWKSNWNFLFYYYFILLFFTGIIMPNWTNWKLKIWSKIGNINKSSYFPIPIPTTTNYHYQIPPCPIQSQNRPSNVIFFYTWFQC